MFNTIYIPNIIFPDEPSDNLDLEFTEQFHNLFLKLETSLNKSLLISV
jgi:ABC-type lipoprotein export system ATPase subunit